MRPPSLMRETLSLLREISPSLRKHQAFLCRRQMSREPEKSIAFRLSDLPVLCDYTIDFRNRRTYLFATQRRRLSHSVRFPSQRPVGSRGPALNEVGFRRA